MVQVGAATEVEMKEKKARVEDALHATRAAVEEGIVPGGGVALLRASNALDNIEVSAEEEFGVKRSHGQKPHDRLTLEYNTELEIAPEWHDFVGELRGQIYQDFLKRAFGRGMLALTFHWHYTPRSCSVSPHCDALRKLGSHIFYFHTDEDWDESWGGQTIVLDDGGRFRRRSSPGFEDFEETGRSRIINNRSFLFARNANSWHGVEALNCPEGAYRKVFIVVIEDKTRSMLHTAYDALSGRKRSRY